MLANYHTRLKIQILGGKNNNNKNQIQFERLFFTFILPRVHLQSYSFHHCLFPRSRTASSVRKGYSPTQLFSALMAEAISGITGGLQGSVNGMLNQGSAWLDSIFPPEKRNELVARISKFAKEKPMLAVRLFLIFLLCRDLKF